MTQSLFYDLRARAEDPTAVATKLGSFHVVHAGGRVHVSASGGSVTLSAPYPRDGTRAPAPGGAYRESPRLRAVRPMDITLRTESGADRRAKASGVSVEPQTGDAAFDARVYVVTPSPADVVRAVLVPPARAAVVALLDLGFSSVEIDTVQGGVLATSPSPAGQGVNVDAVLDAFTSLARALPPVEASGGTHPRDTEQRWIAVGGALALVGSCLATGATYASTPEHCMGHTSDGAAILCNRGPECCGPPGTGAGVGVAVGLVVAAFVAPRIRGRADSHVRRWSAVFLLAVLGLEIGVLISALVR